MGTHVVSVRLSPGDHAALQGVATRQGQPLSTVAARLIIAALSGDPDAEAQATEGALATAVRGALPDLTAPQAVIHREVALSLARQVEQGGAGAVPAAREISQSASRALQAQRAHERESRPSPPALSMMEVLEELREGGTY